MTVTELPVLKPSADRKTKFHKNQKNTYGLLPGRAGSCPGATTGPGGCCDKPNGRKTNVCYVFNLMNVYGGVKNILAHNTQVMQNATQEEMVQILDAEFDRFRKVEMKRPKPELYYRIHWAGDIFSEEYAEALSESIQQNSDIRFWCYTRSMFAVPILCNIENLSFYISLDPMNFKEGMDTFLRNKPKSKHLQLCYMGKENNSQARKESAEKALKPYHSDQIMKLAMGETFTPCPVDTGKLKLEMGCAVCMKCVRQYPGAVWFKT